MEISSYGADYLRNLFFFFSNIVNHCNLQEQTLTTQNFENIRVALEAKIKDADEERKKKDEEMKVALKKQVNIMCICM